VILLYLFMRNWVSHQETELPLHLLRAACIQGANGAGKSAVLNAISWAWYGESGRGTDDLVSDGEEETEVILDWRMADGRTYRVRRKKTLRGNGKSAAELYQHPEAGAPYPVQWNSRPLATGTRAVTKAAEQILGRDYKTFVSTNFLMQGGVEKVITASSSEREKVLADLLGTDHYKELRAKATRRKNASRAELKLLADELASLRETAASKDVLEGKKKDAQARLLRAREQRTATEKACNEKGSHGAVLKSRLDEARTQLGQLNDYRQKHAGLLSRRTSLEEGTRTPQLDPKALELYGSMLPETPDLERAASAAASLALKADDLRSAEQEIQSLEQKEKLIVASIEGNDRHIERYRKVLGQKDRIQAAVAEEERLTGVLQTLMEKEKGLSAEVEEANKRLKEAASIRTEVARLEGAIATRGKEQEALVLSLRTRLSAASDEARLIEKTACRGQGQYAQCVLLKKAVDSRSSIPGIEREIALASAPLELPEGKELSRLKERLSALRPDALDSMLEDATGRLKETRTEADSTRKALSAVSEWSRKAGELETASVEIERHEKNTRSLLAELESVQEDRGRLGEKQASLADLKRRHRVAQLIVEHFRALDALRALDVEIQAVGKDLKNLSQKEEEARKHQRELEGVEAQVKALLEELARRKTEEETLLSDISRLTFEIKRCEEASSKAATNEGRIKALGQDARILELLEEALEKIPFFIIENHLGLIEDEANRVLSEISATGMRIEFRTQKARKNSPNIIDTLDIYVTDESGQGRIERYSGGEKTRLSLALAVGLAELSARSAGKKMNALVIDEPGWLDENGLRDFGECFMRLVESGIFRQGLLIAHDRALLDIFDQKILIEKRDGRSSVTLMT
jgi:exonuclease SbcC